jgi:hypothetical protein
MPPDGPAVEGVYVGGAIRRYESQYFRQENCHSASLDCGRQGGHGVLFAVWVQIFESAGVVAVQSLLITEK